MFSKYAKLYYPEQAMDDYAKSAVLKYLSKPSIFAKKILTTPVYNDMSVGEEQTDLKYNVILQKTSVGTKSRKLHGRLIMLAKVSSRSIEFTFENWEGNEEILRDLFVKEFCNIVNHLGDSD